MRPIESHPTEIVAGACGLKPPLSIDEGMQMGKILARNGKGRYPAVFRLRGVGVKSRTILDSSGKGMGVDYPYLEEAILTPGYFTGEIPEPPSIQFAREIVEKTGMGVAAEIMFPDIQLPLYRGVVPPDHFMPWNPSVDQLGWHVLRMAVYAKENGWDVGIKNPKWLGMRPEDIVKKGSQLSALEKTWLGLGTYAAHNLKESNRLVLIQRGVDIPGKGDYRNLPVHKATETVKTLLQQMFPHLQIRAYIDPSHTNGEKRRDKICDFILECMCIASDDGRYLYDGVLVEVGTSDTDTGQHLTIPELSNLVWDLSSFRNIRRRMLPQERKSYAI